MGSVSSSRAVFVIDAGFEPFRGYTPSTDRRNEVHGSAVASHQGGRAVAHFELEVPTCFNHYVTEATLWAFDSETERLSWHLVRSLRPFCP